MSRHRLTCSDDPSTQDILGGGEPWAEQEMEPPVLLENPLKKFDLLVGLCLLKFLNKLSVWRSNKSERSGSFTWYDGGSYINLGPCALLRQLRSEIFKYEKRTGDMFQTMTDRRPGECRTQLRIQIKGTENIVSGNTRI